MSDATIRIEDVDEPLAWARRQAQGKCNCQTAIT
jgi:hypothetical protein